VTLAVGAVVFASQFPNSSNASTAELVPTFSLSGVAGTTQSRSLTVFRPSANTQTMDSVASANLRNEVLSARAAGVVSPNSSLSSGVTAAAANSGEVGAGVKPLADIIDPRSPIVEYRTQAGDTISGVAGKFGISVQTLLENNKTVTDANLVPKDLVLVVPRKDGILHKVGYGETLDSIVKEYDNITASAIAEYKPNGVAAGSLEEGKYLLLVGAKLKPPPPPPPPPVQSSPGNPGSGPGVGSQPGGGTAIPGSDGIFSAYPVANWRRVSDAFGIPRGSSYHTGIDLDLYGYAFMPIFSACDGVVSKTEFLTYSYGYHVVVDCGGGWKTLYAHMSQIDVVPGQRVSAGSMLGMTGLTGYTTGHHLHFEILYNGGPVNPAIYLGF